ncbi:hypothetical protein KO02_06610 [Sphingobacterium sp. ML3W]|uniref:hypothetical protein n=1 Tax=Sphingobacterium sp. ML3W TaxID=1538644 RepID=UPI0004F63E14|nr:hypothetical protein [Sphingobacterium sp. ML3W]AIM36407.1 hypothetical protein KO02_06610 [Sphingobacterium sp. ML3W]
MKKILFFILLAMFLLGCSKKDGPNPIDKKLYNVAFTAKSFKVTTEPISLKGANKKSQTTLAENEHFGRPTRIRFVIFDSNENIIINSNRSIIPYLNEENVENFWNFKFQLPKGNYKLGVVMYYDEDDYLISIKNTLNGDHSLTLENTRDVFAKRFSEFIVEGDSTYAPLELKRLNGQLMVQLSDAVKAEAGYLRITSLQYALINPFIDQLYLGEEENYMYASSTYDLKDSVGKTNTIYTTNLFPKSVINGSNFNIKLSLLDKNRVLIGSKDITDVLIKSNYRTRLTGPIFDLITSIPPDPEPTPKSNSGFTISINNIFENEILDVGFD